MWKPNRTLTAKFSVTIKPSQRNNIRIWECTDNRGVLNLTLSAQYLTHSKIAAKVTIRKTIDDRIYDEQGNQTGGGMKEEIQYENVELAPNNDEWSFKFFCYEVTGSLGSNANRLDEVTVYIDAANNFFYDSYYEYYLFDYDTPSR